MDDFQKALRDNPSKCNECNRKSYCRHLTWVGEPRNCPEEEAELQKEKVARRKRENGKAKNWPGGRQAAEHHAELSTYDG